MLQGTKTEFFTDVKLAVKAGMQFQNGNIVNAKIKTIGYEVYRHYFDNANKDWQVGSERIERKLKY
jgi:hypothetical protein